MLGAENLVVEEHELRSAKIGQFQQLAPELIQVNFTVLQLLQLGWHDHRGQQFQKDEFGKDESVVGVVEAVDYSA